MFLSKVSTTIERNSILSKLLPFIDKPVIKVLTGILRCGKSTLLKQIVGLLENRHVAWDQIINVNIELMEFNHLKNYEDLYAYIKTNNPNQIIMESFMF